MSENLRPTVDTDVESAKGTALMVLAVSDPLSILVRWLNREVALYLAKQSH